MNGRARVLLFIADFNCRRPSLPAAWYNSFISLFVVNPFFLDEDIFSFSFPLFLYDSFSLGNLFSPLRFKQASKQKTDKLKSDPANKREIKETRKKTRKQVNNRYVKYTGKKASEQARKQASNQASDRASKQVRRRTGTSDGI